MSHETLSLRRLRRTDAPAVHQAFASHPDMVRQGTVTTPEEAAAHVARLVSPVSPHEPWAVVVPDALIRLVCVTVDDGEANGWFWYWMTGRALCRGA